MLIVSDTSPIIALAVCGKLDLLDKLFDQVCISYKQTKNHSNAGILSYSAEALFLSPLTCIISI